MSTEGIIREIVRREGGYVDHPADKGGPTKYGITQATLSRWLGRPATIADVRNMEEYVAEEIYRAEYVAPFDAVTGAKLKELLVDSAVNHGVGRAIRWLQEALGVTADGVIGPRTRRALAMSDYAVVYRSVLRRRIVFFGSIVKNDPSQSVFIEGWLKRACEFI